MPSVSVNSWSPQRRSTPAESVRGVLRQAKGRSTELAQPLDRPASSPQERVQMASSNVGEPAALPIEGGEQQRHEHAGGIVAGQGGIDQADRARGLAKQIGGVRA